MHALVLQKDYDLCLLFTSETHFRGDDLSNQQKNTTTKSWSQMAFSNTEHSSDMNLSHQDGVIVSLEAHPAFSLYQRVHFFCQETMGKLYLVYLSSCLQIHVTIPVLFIASKNSEELMKCYKSLISKEGVSPGMQNMKNFRLKISICRSTFSSLMHIISHFCVSVK